MAIQTRYFACLLCGAAVAALAGCMSVPSAPVAGGRDVGGDAVAPEQSTVSEAVPPAPEELSGIDRVLADRRRSDFPEIETDPAGFTVTEQVRISGDAHARYERAAGLLEQQRFEEAIELLDQLTLDVPQLTAPHVDLGIAYRQVGNLEAAASALETAAQLSPDHPIVRNELGIVYRRSGRFEDARAEYEKALEVFSEFHFARRNLAILCDLYLADAECALQNYRLFLDSVGEDSEVEIWIADLASRSAQNP